MYTVIGKITGLDFLESNLTLHERNCYTTSIYLHSSFPFLGIHPKEISRNLDEVLYAQMFSAGLFTLAKNKTKTKTGKNYILDRDNHSKTYEPNLSGHCGPGK